MQYSAWNLKGLVGAVVWHGAVDFHGIIGYHGPVGCEPGYGAVGFACLTESVSMHGTAGFDVWYDRLPCLVWSVSNSRGGAVGCHG